MPPLLCVVGSSNIDLMFRTSRLPKAGETLAGRSFHLGYGGKGANQAVMATRLGARVALVACVGNDVFGDNMLQNFHAEGIDTTFVRRDERLSSGVASIVVDDDGQNCILLVPGANQALSPENVRQAGPILQKAAVLLCQLEVPLESTLEAFRLARAAEVKTILNPAPAVPLPDELLRLTDWCIPNESEIELLTGLPAGDLGQGEAAARKLLERGPRGVILTLGERGALVVDADHCERVPAYVVPTVDTTGAGDAFIASFGVYLAQGLPVPVAVRRANAVAALSVTRPGTQAAYPRLGELEEFLRKAGS